MVPVPGRSVRGEAGFTILEMLVVLVIFGFMVAVSVPTLTRFTHRANLEQTARQTEQLMLVARREAVKSNVTTNVVYDYSSNQVYAYADANGNNYEDPGEKELGRIRLPQQVYFWSGEDAAPKGANALVPWNPSGVVTCTPSCPTGGITAFLPDGTPNGTAFSNTTGFIHLVHFGDKKDSSGKGNFLELGVLSIGKIELRKYDPTTGKYLLRDENGTPWTWY